MRKKKVLRVVIFALIVMWMIIIFGLSNQNGAESSVLSNRVALLFFSEKVAPIVEPYIRKIAHLTEYAIRRNIVLIFIFYL